MEGRCLSELTASDVGHVTRIPPRPPPSSLPSCVPVGGDGGARSCAAVVAAVGPRGGVRVGHHCRRCRCLRLLLRPWPAISASASRLVSCASPRGPGAPGAGSTGGRGRGGGGVVDGVNVDVGLRRLGGVGG